jgi:hypothetical protein
MLSCGNSTGASVNRLELNFIFFPNNFAFLPNSLSKHFSKLLITTHSWQGRKPANRNRNPQNEFLL